MRGSLHGFVGLSLLLALAACAAPARAQTGGAPAVPATQQTPATPTAPAPKASATSEPVVLDTPGGKLHGTLLVPAAGRAPYPVVLIIAGSGPTDRSGNSPLLPGANNSLRYLAEGLAAKGVASLRFDKRGVAESVTAAKSESDLRFDTYIEDAVLWGQRLRADRRFSSLVVAGHSEGSLIGAVAAQRLGAKLLMVEGMNHVLKLTPADPKQQVASYSDPALPVAPKFLAEVVAFVKAIKK
jgi:pimeloyl-ACP methyl ester carboxylesterase